MGYSTGMMYKRIKVAKRVDSEGGCFGRSSGGQKYTLLGEFWASEKFDKGMKSLREGAVDAYNTVMFRMRYNADIDRWCLIQYQGRWYQIQSFNEDYQTNELQITATEMANQKVTIVYSPTNSSIIGGDDNSREIGR
jgi:SPP1 family predicted phage head-tail adaptor